VPSTARRARLIQVETDVRFPIEDHSEVHQIYLRDAHRTCERVEVSRQLLRHAKLLSESDSTVAEQHRFAVLDNIRVRVDDELVKQIRLTAGLEDGSLDQRFRLTLHAVFHGAQHRIRNRATMWWRVSSPFLEGPRWTTDPVEIPVLFPVWIVGMPSVTSVIYLLVCQTTRIGGLIQDQLGDLLMNIVRSDRRSRTKGASMSIVVPVAVFAFAITLTSGAQTAAPVPAPPAAAVQNNSPKVVQFKAPTIPALKAGQAMAFDLCNGTSVQPPKTDAEGLKMDNLQTPCGEQQTTSPQVSGGSPPYTFHWDSWGFPPLGMQLGQNGLLYGTPAPHIGGYQPFSVCAKDMAGHDACHEVTISEEPAPQVAAHSRAPLFLALLAGGGVAAVVAARTMNSASSSGDSAGQCDGFGSTVNSCGPCTCGSSSSCTDSPQCGGGQCFRYSEDGNQPAPFCSK